MPEPCAIMITRPTVDLAIMSAADLGRIHEAALAYLEQVGVPVRGEAALAALAAAGADADRSTSAALVKIPAVQVERALGLAPSRVVLGARSATQAVVLDGTQTLLATGAGATQVRDMVSGETRSATSDDLVTATTIADYLSEVAVVSPAVQALDTPQAGRALRELELCFAHTTKHIQIVGPHSGPDAAAAADKALALTAWKPQAAAVTEDATGVAGTEGAAASAHLANEKRMTSAAAELSARPLISLRASGAAALEAALVFAAHGLPVAVAAGPVCAAAPAELQAALTLAHASVLAALTVVQSAAPGAPFLYCADFDVLGWESAAPGAQRLPSALSGAERLLFALGAAQLAAHCGLPFVGTDLVTDAHEPDWQASTQNSFAALNATLSGAGLVAGAGLLYGGEVFSAQQLVMDSEIFSVAARISAGIEVDDETIALATIQKVGIGGNYLSERHTRAHMKTVWRPRLLDRSPWDSWVQGGRQGSYDKAGELVASILENADHRKGTT